MKLLWAADHAPYLGYAFVRRLSVGLPRSSALTMAERLADGWWRCAGAPRNAVESNLERLGPGPAAARHRAAREVFRNFARYLVEFFTAHRQGEPEIVVEGAEHLEAGRRGGKGAIVLSAHLGNWELGAVQIARLGVPISVVALPHTDGRTNRLFLRQRERCGMDVIPLGAQSLRQCLRTLGRGRLVGLMGDRDFTGGGMTVPFGGGALAVPRGPAVLSLRSGAPIVPAFLLREGPWRFRLAIEPPIRLEPGPHMPADADALTRRCAAALEQRVLRHADQWLMFGPVLSA